MSYLSRREFTKRSVGALAGAAITGFGLNDLLAKSIPKPTESAWRELSTSLQGRLLRPDSAGYLKLYRPFNRRYANIRPAGIAVVRNAQDVRECVLWAREQEMPLVARAGGHSYGGFSTTRGLIVDFSAMRSARLHAGDGRAELAAGARNQDIVNQFNQHRFTIPAGRCPTVAISGLTLGGGFGFSSRNLGLTADHLVSTEIVTAAGEILRCSERENADLFWACRGGGGGNFGINTSFEFNLSPIGRVAVYKISWRWKDAAEVLETLQSVMNTPPPDEFSLRLGIGSVGKTPAEIRDGSSISALGQFFGSTSDLEDILQPLITAGPAVTVKVEEMDYWAAQRFFYKTAPHNRFASKSHFIRRPISTAGIELLLRAVETRPPSSNGLGGGATFFGWGGRINKVHPGATAFVHRDSIMLMDLDTSWTSEDSPSAARANVRWLEALSENILPYVSGMAYQNFIDPNLKTWRHAYYGSNFDRLVEIKRKWDPERFFRFPLGIPVS